MNLPVTVAREAERQIVAIDHWWRRNRVAAPDLFLDELGAAVEMIGHSPSVGRTYRASPVPATRRYLLSRTRYHVYYVAREDQVRVLAVWHAQRGVGPPLRAT